MPPIRSLCLYCGSREGDDPAFAEAAAAFGHYCASRQIRLVYGGGGIGLMGIAARAALAEGGPVLGIIPYHLDRVEVTMQGLTELIVVSSMHERKHRMFLESDGFVILPGGIGTLDEFIEIVTWAQLELHDKPIVLVDIEGYWEPLLALIRHAEARNFAAPGTGRLFATVRTIDELDAAFAIAGSGEKADLPQLF